MDNFESDPFLNNGTHSPFLPMTSLQQLIPENLEVFEHQTADSKTIELTIDRHAGKMIVEVYKDGDQVGDPLDFFDRYVADRVLGADWILLQPLQIIERLFDQESLLRESAV